MKLLVALPPATMYSSAVLPVAVVLVAVAPLNTYSDALVARVVLTVLPKFTWKAPDTTLVLEATAPDRTSCWMAPLDIVVPLASALLNTYWIAPELRVVAEAEP